LETAAEFSQKFSAISNKATRKHLTFAHSSSCHE